MGKTGEEKDIKAFRLLLRISLFIKPFIGLLLLTVALNICFSTFDAISIATVKPVFQTIFPDEFNDAETIKDTSTTGDAHVKSDDSFDLIDTPEILTGLKDTFYDFLETFINAATRQDTLINLAIFIILIFVFKNIFKYFGTLASVKLEESIIKSIRDKVFSNLTYLSVDYFSKRKEGTLISIITNDVTILNNSTITTFTAVLRESIKIILFLFFLFSISTNLTLIAFSTSVLSILIAQTAMKYIRRYASRMQIAMADYTTTLQESISGIRVIKAYNAEESANSRFRNDTGHYVKSAIKHKIVTAIIPSINEVFAILALSVVLFVGGMQVFTGEMRPSDLMTFLFTLFAIMRPISILINDVTKFQRGFVAAERVFRIIDEKPSVKDAKYPIGGFENEIKISNLSFSYEDSIPVIKEADFSIKKGRKVAFVGPSGSGKSTMLDLLIRFYDPKSGEISIDGRNIRDINIESYRSLFGIVAQESMLFNDSVANNISFGNPDATMDDIINAAKISNAFEFISKLPDGFDTVLGDRGILLSGGERQRISIARALVRNPHILVFDEATSSLDSESEKVVQEAINTSLKDKTAVLVAHRLATIIDCDEIFVFDHGRIVEHGCHEDLLNHNGVYKHLYDIQFARKELGEED